MFLGIFDNYFQIIFLKRCYNSIIKARESRLKKMVGLCI